MKNSLPRRQARKKAPKTKTVWMEHLVIWRLSYLIRPTLPEYCSGSSFVCLYRCFSLKSLGYYIGIKGIQVVLRVWCFPLHLFIDIQLRFRKICNLWILVLLVLWWFIKYLNCFRSFKVDLGFIFNGFLCTFLPLYLNLLNWKRTLVVLVLKLGFGLISREFGLDMVLHNLDTTWWIGPTNIWFTEYWI